MAVSLVPVFDGFSRARKRLRQFVFGKRGADNIPTSDRLKEGNRVLHAAHGCGVLVAVDFEDSHDRPYTVRFDNGEEHRYKLKDVGIKLSLIADPPPLAPISQELQDGPANLRRKSIEWISDYDGPAAAPLRRLSAVALGISFTTPVQAAEAAEVAQDMESGSESSEDEADPHALGPTSQEEGPTNLRRKSIEWISDYDGPAAAPLRRLSAFALGHSFTTPVRCSVQAAEAAEDVLSDFCKDEATSIIERDGKRGTASASEKMQPALNVPELQDKCSVAGCNSPAYLALANGKCVACNNAEGTETDAVVPLPSAASLGRSMLHGVIRASSSWGWPVAVADANSDFQIEGDRRTSEPSRY
jgi:hypothetical protein